MTWFTEGAFIIAALFAINAVVSVLRAISRGKAGARDLHDRKRHLSALEVTGGLLMVASWVVGLALPLIAPESAWGQALLRPWALPSFCVWTMFAGLVAMTAVKLVRRRPPRDAA
jgi:hypothetical protein